MRKARLVLLLAPSALVYACGGGDDSDAGGNDGQADNTVKDGNVPETTTLDGSKLEAGADAPVTVACRRPYDCTDKSGDPDAAYPPSGGVVCCGKLVLTGNPPNCDFNSFTSSCQPPAACPSDIKLACMTDKVRGCAHPAECTENGYDKCCTVTNFGDASVCMSQTIATAINASCLP